MQRKSIGAQRDRLAGAQAGQSNAEPREGVVAHLARTAGHRQLARLTPQEPAQFPRIGGQYADYTESQLVAFRQGTRKNGPMMATIAARMSDAEIKAVSDYIAGLR